MKILVCTDGSKQSLKAIEAAAVIAAGCSVHEVALIHVYENTLILPFWGEVYHVSREDSERFMELEMKEKEKRKEVLTEAEELFTQKNIKVKKIFKEGHPALTIAQTAAEEGSDMVVIGSRGLGGLKKLILGSVSNAVVQEVKCNVLIVK
jgi:nucleotide-binding universal stress UspA family protein